mgnify:CR=1 FL=1
MEDPQTLLAQADAAFANGDMTTAERLYNQIADDTTLPRETVDQAIQRLREVRDRRKTTPKKGRPTQRLDDPPAAALEPPAADVADATTLPPDEAARQAQVQQRVAELLTAAEHLRARQTVKDYDQALDYLDRVLGFGTIPDAQRRDLAAQRAQWATERDALTAPLPSQTPQAAAGSAEQATEQAALAAPPPSIPADQPHDITASAAVQQRVTELQQQARSYLQRPTTANYKQALELYDRMLGFSDLDATQRSDIAQQRVETETAYAQFRAQFGELLTARQLQQDEQELIVVRKLINAGAKTGPDGDELEPHFDKLKESVQQKLLRVAREKVALSDKQVSDGLGFLDSGPLAAAQASLHEAMRLVRGEEITSDDASPETWTAITGIRNLLQDVPELKAALAEYTQHHAAVTAQHDIIVRIKPQFDQADQYFRANEYAQAINELESLRAVAGEQFRSRMVDDLERRAQQYWERDTLTRADLLLEAARTALSRGDDAQVEQQASALIALEPQLQTPALDERRQQARELLAQLRQEAERLARLVEAARQARARGKLPEAERLAREALALRPGYAPAHEVLDDLLYTQVKAALRTAEDALAAPGAERLQISRSALELQRNHVGEIHDARRQKRLIDDIEGTLTRIKRKLDELRQHADRRQQAQALLISARDLALEDRYGEALDKLNQARELDGGLADLDRSEQEIRDDWARFLKRRAAEFMDATPPNPTAALEQLNTLRDQRMEDAASIDLRRRAEQLAYREQGLTALRRGDFIAAIAALEQADLTDPEVRSHLREARRKEAQRLMAADRWSEALQILAQVDSNEPGFPALISRCRAEMLLAEAQTHLQARTFDRARTCLNEAEREPLSDVQERFATLRKQIDTDEALVQRVQTWQQEAEAAVQRFEAHHNRDELLSAIRTLDQALELPDLRAGDSLRTTVQQRRDALQRRYQGNITDERRRLLDEGDQALKAEALDRLPQARKCYEQVLALAPNRQDAEASAGLERVQQQILKLRNQLVEEVHLLLDTRQTQTGQQRGIRPVEVNKLIGQVEAAQKVDSTPHTALNEALALLVEARRACEAAENDLHTARVHWAAARQQAQTEYRDAEQDLERALLHFNRRTYVHIELDRNSLESLDRQMKADREAQQKVASSIAVIQKLLSQSENEEQTAASSSFGELARAEEIVCETTSALAGRGIPGVSMPRTLAERAPQQYRLLNDLASEINSLLQREREAEQPLALRNLIRRREARQRLLTTLDPQNRFGVHPEQREDMPDLTQLETWVQALESGRAQSQQAAAHIRQAQDAEKSRRWQDAVTAYGEAQVAYSEAITQLQIPAAISDKGYSALRTLAGAGQELLQVAQTALDKLEQDQPVVRCEQQIQQALELLDQADTARREERYDEARALANQARDADPGLQNDADRIIRLADEAEADQPNRAGLIAAVVVLLLLAGAAFFFGPGLWEWFSELLFPAGMG